MRKTLVLFRKYGQSLWLAGLDRSAIDNGGLQALLADGIRGACIDHVTLAEAIARNSDYDEAMRTLIQADHEISDEAMFEWLFIQDAQSAADILRPVYVSSRGEDGFVSVEVAPWLDDRPGELIEAARRLWRSVNRSNVMIAVRATETGLTVMQHLVAEGISVHVYGLLTAERYEKAVDAYVRGLSINPNPGEIASVASFSLEPIDTRIDAALDRIGSPAATALKGRAGVAIARKAYGQFVEHLGSTRFSEQKARGGRMQRLMWDGTDGSDTGDLGYLERLIGPQTVSLLRAPMLNVFELRGEVGPTLRSDRLAVDRVLAALQKLGIDVARLMDEVEKETAQEAAAVHRDLPVLVCQKRSAVAKRFAAG